MLDPLPQDDPAPVSASASHQDTLPYEIVEGDACGSATPGLILLCDHASNAFPPGYGTLGMSADQLERHIAYDIGAAAVTRGLAARFRTPAILSRYSRLFIDLNRGVDDPTLVMRLSDGAVIPGNRDADAKEVAHRIATYHAPYHQAVDALIDRSLDAGVVPVLLSVHSFTDRWKTTSRPWHITVLWDEDDRFPRPLLRALEAEEDLCVDENEPYTGSLVGDCMYQHGTQRGLAHGLIEIRQDLIASEAGQAAWVDRLGRILEDIWADKALLNNMRQVRCNDTAK
ncbi:MAG: N-formylglutamate amidohydrolase [Hyphomicrobiaceae bacterium]